MVMVVELRIGDSRKLIKELPDKSIDCVMTSPPYWGLRDYQTEPLIFDGKLGCEHEWIKGKHAGDIRFRGENSIVGNNKNPEIWTRPSRTEFSNRDIIEVCPVCNIEFEGKPGQKFCSIKCLNTLSNEERTALGGVSNFCLKCGAWRGQLGLEPTPELFIKHLLDFFDDVKLKLKDEGNCFVNLGDTYSGSGNGYGSIDPKNITLCESGAKNKPMKNNNYEYELRDDLTKDELQRVLKELSETLINSESV